MSVDKAVQFSKMHGLGNDFVVLDGTKLAALPDGRTIRQWADRRRGIGFDQLLVARPTHRAGATLAMDIFNADGGTAQQCGNGLRCFAVFARTLGLVECNEMVIETPAGLVEARIIGELEVEVDMGEPRFNPDAIPFIVESPADCYRLEIGGRERSVGIVSIGNPHIVVRVEDVESEPVEELGPDVQSMKRFPAGVNVGFMEIVDPHHIRLRVYERGVGETLACGSGACAAMVVGRRQHLLAERVAVELPGGRLEVEWPGQGMPARLTGPVSLGISRRSRMVMGNTPREDFNPLEEERAVIDFLHRHPDVFIRHPSVLETMQVPHACGEAVSLVEFQLRALRERTRDLRRHMDELARNARDNEELGHRIHRLTLDLIDCGSLDEALTRIYVGLRDDFQVDFSSIRLFAPPISANDAGLAELVGPEDGKAATFEPVLPQSKPVCGRLRLDQLERLFGDDAGQVASGVMIRLGQVRGFGVLGLGSRDADRYQPDMGTVLLRRVGDTVARVVAPFLRVV